MKNVWVFCMFLKKVRKVLVFYRYGGGGAQGLRLGEGGVRGAGWWWLGLWWAPSRLDWDFVGGRLGGWPAGLLLNLNTMC